MVETRRQQIGLHGDAFTLEALSCLDRLANGSPRRLDWGSVRNLGRYAASWSAWWPKRPSSTAALT